MWFGDHRCLLWSDIPNNRVMRWDEQAVAVTAFRQPSNFANGHTRDRQGRLLSCEHGSRSVTRTEYDGSVTTILDRFDGKRLNSPNDIVVKSDDSIWFTDPPFGILGAGYEGHRAEAGLPTNIYRFDVKTGQVTVVSTSVNRPNGLCSRRTSDCSTWSSPAHCRCCIRVFDVSDGGDQLYNDGVFYSCKKGERPDGFRCDVDGNLWAGWGTGEGRDGVMVFAPDGTPIGHIALPERCANVCFGGVARNRLFMAASQSVYSLYVNTQGAVWPDVQSRKAA